MAAPDPCTGVAAQSGASPRPVAFQVGDAAFASGAPFDDVDEGVGVFVERTNRVIAQARTRVDGDQPDGATRLVSLHEPDARPIRKGRLGRPVEFGYKALC